ncbi:MAG: VCBS repeat-containing protein, partial [Candidatus Acidiferrum sp.]
MVAETLSYFSPLLLLALLTVGCQHGPSEGTSQSSSTASPPSTEASPSSSSTPTGNSASPARSEAARASGPIEFVDVTAQAGIRFKHNTGAFGKKYLPETMGSGVCVIDYDNDGWPDIFFVNSMDWPEHQTSKSFPALYHNNHDGTFTDVTRQAGLAIETYGL